ncbi:MAG: ACP S-malonyltransferase [Egibacteraceae bacterium]
MAVALVFPGQGSQREQMAAAWREHPAFARWAQADELLGFDVTRLGLDAGAEELREPANCQVALFVHGCVLLEAWRGAVGHAPVVTAGHSLGEYNALVAAGALGFADGLRLVEARARATQAAAEQRPGTMVACLGFAVEDVRAASEETATFVANDNAPGQVTVAGEPEALERLKALLGERAESRRQRVVDVQVGAAYHSPHMEPAVAPFSSALDTAEFEAARMPVVANVDAAPHAAAEDWPALLRQQLVSPVRWRETVLVLRAEGGDEVVELCAAPVLTGLVKRTDAGLGRRSISAPDDLEG